MKTWISVALLAFVCFFQKGECAINGWTRPIIGGATGDVALVLTIKNKVTTVTGLSILATTDLTTATTGLTHSLVTQAPTTGATFAIDTAGTITISSGATDYATATEYVLTISANDNGGTASTATTTLSVDNNPAFSAQQYLYCISSSTGTGVTIATLTATTTTTSTGFAYLIASGNDASHFEMDGTTGVIKTTTTASFSATVYAGYMLTITAAQTTPALTGTSTVWIGVGCSSGATILLAGCITLLMTLMAHLF